MDKTKQMINAAVEGDFSDSNKRCITINSLKKLQSDLFIDIHGVGRILEDKDYNVWGCSPIYDDYGNIHVFYSRWKNCYNRLGWVAACEVCHAVAKHPEGPYVYKGVVLQGRGGERWDSWSIHNPSIYKVDGKYVLLYMGSDGSKLDKDVDEISSLETDEFFPYFQRLVQSKRVGMAIADSLDGPFIRVSDKRPMIDVGCKDEWDSFCTSNPTFVKTPDNKYRIYYKAWDFGTAEKFNGNRKYGFAECEDLTGEYVKYPYNPVIDYSSYGEKIQAEDGYIWYSDGKYQMVLRDMGIYNAEFGLHAVSDNGIDWEEPKIAFLDSTTYFKEKMIGISREGRFERPQILLKDGEPEYLFCGFRGGKYKTSSGVVLKFKE